MRHTKIICFISLLFFFVINPLMAGAGNHLALWKQSYQLEQAKHYEKAAQVLFPVLYQCPRDEFLLLRLGWLNYLGKHYNEAIEYYACALNRNPCSIDARLGLTLPLLAQSRWKEAGLYAKQVIAISAWNYYGHIRLMTSEAGQFEWEILECHAAQVALRYPSDPTVLSYLALARAMLSKRVCSLWNYYQVLERSPEDKEAIKYLCRLSCC